MAHPTLHRGSLGPEVEILQALLTRHGYACAADGDFGKGTEKKVKAFQKAAGLDDDGIVGKGTWAALEEEIGEVESAIVDVVVGKGAKAILEHAATLGHKVDFEAHRMWYFGVRSPTRTANVFDDALGCIWTDSSGNLSMKVWPGTTDPGTYWLNNPMRTEGTAILKEGQYLDCWKLGLHNGKYMALIQTGNQVKVYRDGDRDNVLEMAPDSVMEGWFGINMHRATVNGESTQVNKWSAGCQVTAVTADHDEKVELAEQQTAQTGRDTYSNTLMDQWW
jgi:hypothetical protein